MSATELATEARALAEQAAVTAGEGRINEARQGFTKALEHGGTDLRVLFLCFQFHFRVGELDEAERFVRRRLEVAGPDADNPDTARAYSNLGLINHRRGDLEAAEAALQQALAIDSRLRDDRALARDLGNLALIPESRCELDRAESLYSKALAIAERIGAEDLIATKLANLGDIAITRARPDEARRLWTRAVEIFGRIGPAKFRDEFATKLADLDSDGRPSSSGA